MADGDEVAELKLEADLPMLKGQEPFRKLIKRDEQIPGRMCAAWAVTGPCITCTTESSARTAPGNASGQGTRAS